MTKDELVESLTGCELPEDQLALACEVYDKCPNAFVPDREMYISLAVEERDWVAAHFEDCREEVFLRNDVSTYFPATGDVRQALRQQVLHAIMPELDSLHGQFTPEAMIFGYLISYWVFCAEDAGCMLEGMHEHTIHTMALLVLWEAFDEEMADVEDEFLQSSLVYAISLHAARIRDVSTSNEEYTELVTQVYPEYENVHERYVAPCTPTMAALDALDAKFQALTDERDALQRRLNRGKDIAAAIRNLQIYGDKDESFKYQYQWKGVYEVMKEYHLLRDDKVATFCRICNNPDSPEYFLPEDEAELPNHYIGDKGGKSYDRGTTWHQISSRNGNEERKKMMIDKTKKEFSLLLKEHGIIE